MSDITHKIPSRVLTDTEMAFFSWTKNEREAIALAKVCTLPKDATHDQIQDAALKCLCAALEFSGLKDEIEQITGTNYAYRRKP